MTFFDRMMTARAERYLLMGGRLNGTELPGLLVVLEKFTPEGLLAFIEADQSLVALYRQALGPQMVGGIAQHGAVAQAVVGSLDWGRVLNRVTGNLPHHGRVLAAHRAWYDREVAAVSQLLREVSNGTHPTH